MPEDNDWMPQHPDQGPPLPKGFSIKWPGVVMEPTPWGPFPTLETVARWRRMTVEQWAKHIKEMFGD